MKSLGFCFFILNLCFIQLTEQASILPSLDNSYYTAGVVEFRPAHFSQPHWTSQQQLEDNLLGYIDIIQSAEAQETDIIVFPEMTLNTNDEASFVPDPENISTPICDSNDSNEYHQFLQRLSCAARNASKYIVINIVERADCESTEIDPRPCQSHLLFNTNVVFDRQGVVVSRYRKVHLYGEPRNTTFVPSFGYFDTDFGIRFGHFVCFDIMFYMPAQEMVEKWGIRDFIFPTMWFSQLPFLTAVQVQSAWSYANDVNFLAAGASFPPVGTTGTGIYAGRRGTLNATMNRTDGERKLFVSRLQKYTTKSVERRSRRDSDSKVQRPIKARGESDIYLKQDYIESYNSVLLDLDDNSNYENTFCYTDSNPNSEFCCYFKVNWTQEISETALGLNNDTHYSYRLGVFNGLRKEQAPETNKLRNCALFACVGPDITDCGKVFITEPAIQIVFTELVIEANFPNASELLIMPNSLRNDLLPVPVSDFDWKTQNLGPTHKVRYELKRPVPDLLAFSIYGNYYDSQDDVSSPCSKTKDEQCDKNPGDDGAASIAISLILLVFGIIVSCISVLI